MSDGSEKRDYPPPRIIGMLKACCAARTSTYGRGNILATCRVVSLFPSLHSCVHEETPSRIRPHVITISDNIRVRTCLFKISKVLTTARRIAAVRLPHWPVCLDTTTASGHRSISEFRAFDSSDVVLRCYRASLTDFAVQKSYWC